MRARTGQAEPGGARAGDLAKQSGQTQETEGRGRSSSADSPPEHSQREHRGAHESRAPLRRNQNQVGAHEPKPRGGAHDSRAPPPTEPKPSGPPQPTSPGGVRTKAAHPTHRIQKQAGPPPGVREQARRGAPESRAPRPSGPKVCWTTAGGTAKRAGEDKNRTLRARNLASPTQTPPNY